MNLRKAREKGELDKFIAEHENDAPGDAERLEKAIQRASQGKMTSSPQ